MKALTLTQPWATLVAIGAKRFETRSWGTSYRGPLAIHAAKGLGSVGGPHGLVHLAQSEPFRTAIVEHFGAGLSVGEVFPLGGIVAVCQLEHVWRAEDVIDNLGAWSRDPGVERAFGDYTAGRFAWQLHAIQKLETTIPCRGALGLWDVPAEIAESVAVRVALYGPDLVRPTKKEAPPSWSSMARPVRLAERRTKTLAAPDSEKGKGGVGRRSHMADAAACPITPLEAA